MIKRVMDIVIAGGMLVVTAPIQLLALLAIYSEDKAWPIYAQPRAGVGGKYFRMYKMRTMVVGADKGPTDATTRDDKRVTRIGAAVRRYKLDELPQLWNVLMGDMSIVGPRPQVERYVRQYTKEEEGLMAVRPGITDFSSIVFADQAELLAGHPDPNVAYNQLMRPGKSRLGLFYIARQHLWSDVALMGLTALSFVSRPLALRGVACVLNCLGAPPELVELSLRKKPLVPAPPPGSDAIFNG